MENPNTTQVSDAEESMENLTIEFGQTETVHQWCKLPECDEVVGSRFVFIKHEWHNMNLFGNFD